MAAISVMKKLQRCERIHAGRPDDYLILTYKIKIKECASSSSSLPCTISINSNCCSLPLSPSTTRALSQLTDSLARFAPTSHEKISTSHEATTRFPLRPPLKLQSDSRQELAPYELSCHSKINTTPGCKLQLLEVEAAEAISRGESNSAWKPPGDTSRKEKERSTMPVNNDDEEGMWAMFPRRLELQDAEEEEEEDGEGVKERFPHESEHQAGALERKQAQQQQIEEGGQMKQGEVWEVKRVECECCGMEEECTRGYEERVRGELGGHWLCGLCGEAVREERKRLGGRAAGGERSLQAALKAHMEPCRGFSSLARARASPPPSAVTVPHAVCRLLRRHLSTSATSPRPAPSSSLPRSSSCLPSFHVHTTT
ncbi:hypothetical protein GOP47_0011911 [Adiantum capillus-veneris]|uniref:Uncharacterized protein n=1 Tax=Adiantum capillus-veneris TaxID=13818 RepID=A0A9D4ZFU2_ADICA|nr:hypothetical protein GOP47_0011911 [Adiantum capillus-veneris]